MNNPQSEKCVRAFIDSYYTGDVARMESCCADSFSSLTHAPIEIFPHLGFQQAGLDREGDPDSAGTLFRTSSHCRVRHCGRNAGGDTDTCGPYQTQRRACHHALCRRVLQPARRPDHRTPLDVRFVRSGAATARARPHRRIFRPHEKRDAIVAASARPKRQARGQVRTTSPSVRVPQGPAWD